MVRIGIVRAVGGTRDKTNGNDVCYRNRKHMTLPKIDPGSPVTGRYGAGMTVCDRSMVQEFEGKTFSFKFEYGGKNGVPVLPAPDR